MTHLHVPPEDKRAGNEDRDRYIDHLAASVSTGHLKPWEFDERRDKALQALTHGDLQSLVRDLPAVKQVVKHKVTYQVMTAPSGNIRFSPWRWVTTTVPSLAMVILTGPFMAQAFHGFDNAPLAGAVPTLLIFLGVILTLVFGIGFAPDHTETEYK